MNKKEHPLCHLAKRIFARLLFSHTVEHIATQPAWVGKFWPKQITAAFGIEFAATVLVAAHFVLSLTRTLCKRNTLARLISAPISGIDSTGFRAATIERGLEIAQIGNRVQIKIRVVYGIVGLVMLIVTSTRHKIISKKGWQERMPVPIVIVCREPFFCARDPVRILVLCFTSFAFQPRYNRVNSTNTFKEMQ